MTLFFTSDQIIILKYRQKSGMVRDLSATFTVYPADIQPVADERLNLVGGRIGKLYQAFVDPDVPVREGDALRIVDSGKVYSVKAVSTWQGAELLDHKELLLMAQD